MHAMIRVWSVHEYFNVDPAFTPVSNESLSFSHPPRPIHTEVSHL